VERSAKGKEDSNWLPIKGRRRLLFSTLARILHHDFIWYE
jgi:hypothetical protein